MFNPVFFQVDQVFADRIGRALIPIGSRTDGLLRRQEFDESAGEVIESVCLSKVTVQTLGKKLRQQVSPIQSAVDSVDDGDVDQSILARQRHRGFGTILG